MHDGRDLEALRKDLDGIAVEDNPQLVKQKSRDFFWYSPVLKRQLDHVHGDLVATPKTDEELLAVLSACFRHDVPVTPRGAGTGNYGQAMPLDGGLVLDLSQRAEIRAVTPETVVTGPGAIMERIDEHTVAAVGRELRMFPSTYRTASIGGFVGGGSGGVGSIRWGGLRDLGNVTRLKLATMEASPRTIELSGDEIQKAAHAYGTTGIITEVEVPLCDHHPWVDVLVTFETTMAAARFGHDLAHQDGLLPKEIAVVAPSIPSAYFLRHRPYLPEGRAVAILMVAPSAVDGVGVLAARHGGEVALRADRLSEEDRKPLPPAFELSWNHTTLRALRVDQTITYLQVLYPQPDILGIVEKMERRFGDEVPIHLEFVRFNGAVGCFGLPLVRFSGEERLEEIIRIHDGEGAPIFNPHRYTLEEGGMKNTDPVQLAFKREADPKGLLNPGKMVAWEDPDFDFAADRPFLFRSHAGAAHTGVAAG